MNASPRSALAAAERAPGPSLLGGRRARLFGDGAATRYSAALLTDLGARVECASGPADPDPAHDWARCGAMVLTGRPTGLPRVAPGPLASCARGALAALAALAPRVGGLDGPALLGERAAIAGLRRRGEVAPGGSCRLLRARDGWIALNLARDEDARDLPAWLETEGDASHAWDLAARGVAQRETGWLAERARWLGLAVAVADEPPDAPPPWLRIPERGPAAEREGSSGPLVVDLSSLWAGPLASHLLRRAGARVVKVESAARPDGARRGPAAFFDLLNAGAESVALDFASPRDRARLHALLRRADVVLESARPRALAQLGIDAGSEVRDRAGLTWLSITGYGRSDPAPGRVAFGDDAGVAAGLARAVARGEPTPLFCGDAIADPVTGLHAALAAWASWSAGGGHLLDLALCDVTAHALLAERLPSEARVERRGEGFEVVTETGRAPVLSPRARSARGSARPLGADTQAVLRELAPGC